MLLSMEKDLAKKCPESNLKVKPHIKSKLKFLREQYGIVFDMLNQSGFGWNEDIKFVEIYDGADRTVLNAYLMSHKRAKRWVNKEFTYFERLGLLYGKDRATRKGAEALTNVVENFDNEANNENDDGYQTTNSVNQNENVEDSRKRCLKHNETLANGLIEAIHIFGSYFDKSSERLDRITERIGHGKQIYDDQRNTHDELEKMDLSTNDKIEVNMLIMDKPQNIHLFWGFKGYTTLAFVQRLLV
ncbi:hypothetical protein REPUB_Repub01dG0213700 [Reevesia pubescens]